MAKCEVSNLGSRDHIPGQMEGSCQKEKIEGLGLVHEELHSDEQSAVGDYHLQLPFTTACAIMAARSAIDNLLHYKSPASAPSLVVEVG